VRGGLFLGACHAVARCTQRGAEAAQAQCLTRPTRPDCGAARSGARACSPDVAAVGASAVREGAPCATARRQGQGGRRAAGRVRAQPGRERGRHGGADARGHRGRARAAQAQAHGAQRGRGDRREVRAAAPDAAAPCPCALQRLAARSGAAGLWRKHRAARARGHPSAHPICLV